MDTLSELRAEARAKRKEARGLIAQIDDSLSTKEAREVERKFNSIMSEVDDLNDRIEEQREAEESASFRSNWPRGENMRVSGADNGPTDAHTKAFKGWIRSPDSRRAQNKLDQVEPRSANSLTDSAGGYIVPETIAGPMRSRARDVNPLRGLVRVVPVMSGDVVVPLSNNDATSGWVGETDTRTPTTEPTIDGKRPTFGINYSYVKMSEELATDALYDIGDWFIREAGSVIGEAEMTSIISGNGSNKPKGLLNTAPEAGDDGARSADAFKFLASASASAFTADELLDLVYDLKARYRANGNWLMNSATTGYVRKLKDSNGAYLWQDSLMAGQPSTFSGYPVTICEAMPDIGASEHPVAFGDFDAAYILCTIGGFNVTNADRNVTEPGFHKLYIRQRIGGCVYDENALRFLKMASS